MMIFSIKYFSNSIQSFIITYSSTLPFILLHKCNRIYTQVPMNVSCVQTYKHICIHKNVHSFKQTYVLTFNIYNSYYAIVQKQIFWHKNFIYTT